MVLSNRQNLSIVLDESVDDKCNLDADSDDELNVNKTLQDEIAKINQSLTLINTLMKK